MLGRVSSARHVGFFLGAWYQKAHFRRSAKAVRA